MQFDDGSGDVHQGEDITITANGQTQDLGAATYDSDHDGIADSVVVGEGDHVLVFTDHDHDGRVDSVTEYDSSGHQVQPDSSGTSDGDTSDTGNTNETSGHSGGDTTGTDTSGHTGGTDTGGTTGTDTGSDTSAGTITVTADDGSHTSVGAPTVDLNQDGHPDTTVVKHSDGSVTGYTDRDGDGQADQITQINADGSVVITTHDGSGEWHVSATGHVDSSGKLVEDSSPTTTSTQSVPNTIHAGDDGSTTPTTTTGTDTHTGNQTGNQTGNDTNNQTNNETGNQTTTHGGGDITFSAGGKEYDLGKPTADMNGDGTPDTVVSHQADGTVIGYTDTDGDGTADQVTEISPDGHVTIGASDGHGNWHQVATGHMENGKFVADSGSTTTTAGAGASGS